MRVIIVGAGKMGFYLAERLSAEEHSVTVIEADAERRQFLDYNLDVLSVQGNGANPRVLKEAGVDGVDLVIAATDIDEINMIACAAAKQCGAKKCIARVRDISYISERQSEMNRLLGIDFVINPEMIAASELAQIIKTPAALNVEDFAGDKVRMLEVKIRPDSRYANQMIKKLGIPANILVAGILRHNKMIIPHGNDAFEARDNVFLIGEKSAIIKLEEQFTLKRSKVGNIFIVGAGRIGTYLAGLLENQTDIKVTIIDRDKHRCEEAAKRFSKAAVVHGDAGDIELLSEHNIKAVDAIVCVTQDDKLNLLIALMAKQLGVEKTFVRVGRTEYIPLMESFGLDVVFSPRLLAAGVILRHVRHGDVISLHLVEGAKAEILELNVCPKCKAAQKKLKDLKFPKNALIGAVVRDEATTIPNGDTIFEAGDRVIAFTLPEVVEQVTELFEGR